MSDTITLKIDDVEVTVAAQTTILDAAATVGIDIPHLCHDPNWSIPPSSSCRLCIVEVEGARAPVASCSQHAADGMVVRTDTEKIREYRRMVIELLLSDHPQDCMTCEQGGGCSLQEYAYSMGISESGYSGISGPVEPRPVQDGPAVIYDRSKCILCGRCVEVCHNVQSSGAIEFSGRGFDTEIALPPGQTRRESVCSECGNCIDVCPTGAMAGSLGQGLGRNWEFEETETICPYCGCGCTLVANVRDNKIVKITGRGDLGVNEGMLCVKGRFGIDFMGHSERLTQPLVRKDGELQPVEWGEALGLVAERLTQIRSESGPDSIAGLASAKCTNEENYILQKFIRGVIGTNNVDHCARLCHSSTVAGLARAFGSGAMTNSIEDFEVTDCIFVIGSNTTECHPIIGSAIKRAVDRGAQLIVADPRKIELVGLSDLHMAQRSGTDVALINAMMYVILEEGLADEQFIAERTEGFAEFRAAVEPCTPELAEKITTVPAADIVRAARMYAKAPAASIVYSMGITQHTTGTDNVLSLANLAMLTGNIGKPGAGVNPLRGQNNVQGACDLGALPNVYPGYQKVDVPEVQKKFQAAWGAELSPTPGLTVVEMMNAGAAGDLKALYLMGENPMLSDPDQNHVREALEKIDFVVVQDIFLTETAELADVVLPAAGFAEKVGTFTNTERRVQLLHKAIEAPGEARLDWEIVCDLASRMGYEMSYADAGAIEDEIASVSPIYGGIVYPRLADGPLQWPCPDAKHPGTPYLHKDKFSRGLGKFHPVEFVEARELPDDEFPILLTTGRVLEHFHTGSMTRRSQVLDALVPTGSIEISSFDADELGVADGATVKVTSRRGEIEVAARISPRMLPGTVFLAFHYRESPANRLTIAALDPIAKIPELKVCAVRIEAC
ncbi:MAG: formate dehydrogenase subunit alpha [Phycisphaerae bacterium]|jgi:formate dehydrogenase alpha subunit|nr:formate dehydrogenase subunit alpha [Phycisphaerae bacterium]